MNLLKACWLILFNPLKRAEERYLLAASKLAAQRGEVRYHSSMLAFYETECMGTNPSTEWWQYAQFKDKVVEHRKELTRAIRKERAFNARYVALSHRWQDLRKQEPREFYQPLYTTADPPPRPSLNDTWYDGTDIYKWNGETWVVSNDDY